MHRSSSFFFFFCKFQTISDKILPEFEKVRLKFPLSPYIMLRTHNTAWRKLHSLFLNIVKRGKGRETKNCPNSSFSHNFCHWLYAKNFKLETNTYPRFCLQHVSPTCTEHKWNNEMINIMHKSIWFTALVYIIHRINRISGGDRSDKRETCMPAWFS